MKGGTRMTREALGERSLCKHAGHVPIFIFSSKQQAAWPALAELALTLTAPDKRSAP